MTQHVGTKRLAQTRERIFYAAAELFAEYSYSDVSIRDIAKKVGIRASSIYNHYASKESILESLIDYYDERVEKFTKGAESVDFSGGDPFETFKKLVFYFDSDEIELMTWLMRILYNEQFKNERVAKIMFEKSKKRTLYYYRDFFESLQKRGIVKGNNALMYAEILSRVSSTFAMQHVNNLANHDEHLRPTMEDLYMFVFKLATQCDVE